MEAIGEMESQEDRISETQNKEIKTEETEIKYDRISETQNTPEVTVSDLPPREYKVLSPLLPWTPRHIEWRRRLGQNPAFLPALKRVLIKARKKLVAHSQDLEEDPMTREDKDKAV